MSDVTPQTATVIDFAEKHCDRRLDGLSFAFADKGRKHETVVELFDFGASLTDDRLAALGFTNRKQLEADREICLEWQAVLTDPRIVYDPVALRLRLLPEGSANNGRR